MSSATLTWLTPTVEAAQARGLLSKVASSHCGVACGLTLRPGGRSTRTSLSTPTGFTPGAASLSLTMNWVKPKGGCAAAWVANCGPGLSGLQFGSKLHTPACQPSAAVGGECWGAMMSPVSADAAAGPRPATDRVASATIRILLTMAGLLPVASRS